jgi:uncharacterized membrane-anchored protein
MPENKAPNLKLFLAIVAGIVLVLLGFIASQEFTLRSGEDMYLKTVPVDPRDILRGDYVILSYEFEQDPILLEFMAAKNIQDNEIFYIWFSKDTEQTWTISGVSREKPDSGIFLKVRKKVSRWSNQRIDTGIDKYFVPEWTGRMIERVRGDMKVHVKVDKNWWASVVDLYYRDQKIDPKTFNL